MTISVNESVLYLNHFHNEFVDLREVSGNHLEIDNCSIIFDKVDMFSLSITNCDLRESSLHYHLNNTPIRKINLILKSMGEYPINAFKQLLMVKILELKLNAGISTKNDLIEKLLGTINPLVVLPDIFNVVELSLSGNNINYLPVELRRSRKLMRLDISDNCFKFFSIKRGEFENLEYLDISDNQMLHVNVERLPNISSMIESNEIPGYFS